MRHHRKPVVHFARTALWIAGSSPAMTKKPPRARVIARSESDEAIRNLAPKLDCFAPLAMTHRCPAFTSLAVWPFSEPSFLWFPRRSGISKTFSDLQPAQ